MTGEECLMNSLESRRHHFEVEKELATRLRNSTREERSGLASELYAELYRRVPDHPRIARSQDSEAVERTVAAQMRLVRPFLNQDVAFLEFGAGSGSFSKRVAPLVAKVTALEVCDQSGESEGNPPNFEMVLHDGMTIPLPDGSYDVAFSYQVLEHLHPEDVPLHLREIFRVLRPGGAYVLSTPHAASGPHDISRYFTRGLETFHLKEWTYGELSRSLREAGFSRVHPYIKGKTGSSCRFLVPVFRIVEGLLAVLPASVRTWLARKFLNNVVVSVLK